MKIPREYRQDVDRALAAGWRLRATRRGYLLLHPSGTGQVSFHATPSDVRAHRNFRADLRRLMT